MSLYPLVSNYSVTSDRVNILLDLIQFSNVAKAYSKAIRTSCLT